MSQSLSQVYLHIVYSTKHRAARLQDNDVRTQLYAVMANVLKDVRCPALIINGTADHVHILCRMSRTITIASLIETSKTEPSRWMKEQGLQYADFHWQSGYGAFSVSASMVDTVYGYIERQQEHHARGLGYQDEFRELCRRHGVEIDERYVWD
jgi:putative transposase